MGQYQYRFLIFGHLENRGYLADLIGYGYGETLICHGSDGKGVIYKYTYIVVIFAIPETVRDNRTASVIAPGGGGELVLYKGNRLFALKTIRKR